MSTPPTGSAEPNAIPRSSAAPVATDRRRRKRAKITAQVHVRGLNSPEPFEEVCKSIDVSRDGLLFTAARTGYWKGQRLEVTFPYSTAAAALNTAQPAEIVRVVEQDGHYAVAVQFINAKSEAVAGATNADPSMVGASLRSGSAKQQSVVLIVESDPK
ncbi:MAG: PilZ domain-containing protein, partial [Candidatus Acidiferrales bacterium]